MFYSLSRSRNLNFLICFKRFNKNLIQLSNRFETFTNIHLLRYILHLPPGVREKNVYCPV